MKINDFEHALSPERLKRYLDACNNDTRKAMFTWMDIDSNSMLYGLDHVRKVCDEINILV